MKLFKVTILGLAVLISSAAKAQDFGTILAAGVDDANTYFEAYLAPGINSLASGMAGGWNNTAKPHSTFGVDVTFSFNMATVPEMDRVFSFSNLSMNTMQFNGSGDLPTLVGPSGSPGSLVIPANTTVQFEGQSITVENEASFEAPGGIPFVENLPQIAIPAPTLQIGIGLIKGTDLKIRLIPEQTFGADGDISLGLFGIGVLHDFKQWIPGFKAVPIDVSAFFGYTKFSAGMGVDVNQTSGDVSNGTTFSGSGNADFTASATTFQILASKKLAIFTPYIGFGLNAINSSLALGGTYDYTVTATPPAGAPVVQAIEIIDPIDMEFSGAGGPRVTVGGRLKLAVLTIHVDYTVQKYSMLSAGLGLSFR
ncbi:MAG: hypothetical protein JXQ90_07650 [Cyclobacteriaceae bacterium]